MLDAVAKVPAGISQGQINWLGSYKICNDIHFQSNNSASPPIKGKYCNAVIGFPAIETGIVCVLLVELRF